ncbi:hypothetical protein AMJ57_03185 [Parcubacteria bacterium SG8_24]|nr:MAG: hypothetical protein AMJ57_03185 [Parcubacteria bacterium SG8_24]
MRPVIIIAVLSVFLPKDLRAADEAPVTPPVRADLIADFGMIVSDTGEGILQRPHLLFGPELTFRDIVVFMPYLRLSTMSMSLDEPSGAPFQAEVHLPWQLSLGCSLRIWFLRFKWLDLAAFGEFEFPMTGNDAELKSFGLTEDVSDLDIEEDAVRERVSAEYDWRRVVVGIAVRGRFGRWRPFLEGGYIHVPGRLAVEVDDEVGKLLREARAYPKPYYEVGYSTFYYMAGLEVAITERFDVHTRLTAAPLNEGWMFYGELGVRVPLDIW